VHTDNRPLPAPDWSPHCRRHLAARRLSCSASPGRLPSQPRGAVPRSAAPR